MDEYVRRLIDDMLETMRAASGVGLAANQVGLLRRIIVVDVGAGVVAVINPEITACGEGEKAEEGCLSLPGQRVPVKRAPRIELRGLDRDGQPLVLSAEGLFARALQHEVDHLNGILIKDYREEWIVRDE